MRKLLILLLIAVAILGGGFLGIRDADIPYDTLVERYAQEPSQFATLESGRTVHYRDRGPKEAPVLLLLHGSNASLYTWEPWVAELSGDYRVITLDLLGHGLSALSPDMDYTTPAYVSFVSEFVDHMDLEHFTLAGNSMGGGIAWRYALDHQDKLDALVLLDASGIPRPPEEEREVSLIYKIAAIPGLNQILLHVLPKSVVEAQLLDAVAVDEVVTEEMVTRYHAFLLREGAAPTPWRA